MAAIIELRILESYNPIVSEILHSPLLLTLSPSPANLEAAMLPVSFSSRTSFTSWCYHHVLFQRLVTSHTDDTVVLVSF